MNLNKIKAEKIAEMNKLYENLTANQETLDKLMIRIGKDLEEKFPGIKFRLIARTKTKKSFNNKIQNDLVDLDDPDEIKAVKIYDIIALSIIIEETPFDIKSRNLEFDLDMPDIILERRKENVRMEKARTILDRNKIKLENEKRKKERLEAGEVLQESEESIDEKIRKLEEGIKRAEKYIEKKRAILNNEENINKCNRGLAEYIIGNITEFDNVKKLGLVAIPRRLKPKHKRNGYIAWHNCYVIETEDVPFICEIQGKSIKDFYNAEKGEAARYHIKQKQEPGKIAKEIILPNLLEINTKQKIQSFINWVTINVPRFRIYRSRVRKDKNGAVEYIRDVYKLSLKECFMLYYSNHLFGNPILGMKTVKKEILENFVKRQNLPTDDGEIYRDGQYLGIEDR